MRLPAVIFTALAIFAACKKSDDLSVTADEKGFHPSTLDLKKGRNGHLTFTRTTDKTCAKEVVFKEKDTIIIKKDLPLNTPVAVDIPTDKERTLTFTCGMGMFESQLVVQ